MTDDEKQNFAYIYEPNDYSAKREMTMKRYEARREKGNALLEFYMKNNTQYKSLKRVCGYFEKCRKYQIRI